MNKLGCDIDDCLLCTSDYVISTINKHFNLSIKKGEVTDFNLEHVFNLDKQQVHKLVVHTLRSNIIRPRPKAIDILNWLSEYYDITFITNRGDDLYYQTKLNLDNIGLNFKYGLHLCAKQKNGVPDKANYIKDNNINTIIEDRADTAVDIVEVCNATVLLMTQPWNIKAEETECILRMNTWTNIINYFKPIIKGEKSESRA